MDDEPTGIQEVDRAKLDQLMRGKYFKMSEGTHTLSIAIPTDPFKIRTYYEREQALVYVMRLDGEAIDPAKEWWVTVTSPHWRDMLTLYESIESNIVEVKIKKMTGMNMTTYTVYD